jgi:hypothetical protein
MKTSMPRVGLEPTTPLFEQAKTVHALDRAVTVISPSRNNDSIMLRILSPHLQRYGGCRTLNKNVFTYEKPP